MKKVKKLRSMLENHKEKESEKAQTMLVQLKEVMDDHKDVSLSEILKEKQCIVTRIEDFDIDCVLDEETHVNIMPESTWEILGKPAMIPSLGRIGLFKGKMITLCGRVTNIPMISHETSTEEDFEVIRFVENNAPFPLLLGKTWIEKDQIRRKAEEEATEQKKQELRDFIARKIERLIEEQEDKSKQQRTRELVVEVERTQEGLKNLSMQERSIATPEIVREGTLTTESVRVHQQCEVLSPGENKNTNGKRIPEIIREAQITGKKARKLNRKKAKLQEATKNRRKTSQEADLQNLNLAGIAEPCRMGLRHGEAI
jgi:hypothetical protein